MGGGRQRANPGQRRDGDAGGRVHAEVDGDQSRSVQGIGIELLQREVDADDFETGGLQKCGGRGQVERLAAQFVRVDQNGLERQLR